MRAHFETVAREGLKGLRKSTRRTCTAFSTETYPLSLHRTHDEDLAFAWDLSVMYERSSTVGVVLEERGGLG